LGRIISLGESAEFDPHLLAHLVFDLDPPEEMMEIGGTLKDICDLVLELNDDERRMLKSMIVFYRDEYLDGGEAPTKEPAKEGFG